jgi:predicted metal-dependent HD superfamily phosphohydrolase
MSVTLTQSFWRNLQDRHDETAWTTLDAAYREAHRAYHAWEHIDDLLQKLDTLRMLAVRVDLVAAAIFWHDAVYATRDAANLPRADVFNVEESEALFQRHSRFAPDDAHAVCVMIMATANHMTAKAQDEIYPGFGADLDLFLDLDLSSLAAPWPVFADNLEKIRYEYSWVPEQLFCLGRLHVLEQFSREEAQLYRRPEAQALWLNAARANMARSMTELRERLDQLG